MNLIKVIKDSVELMAEKEITILAIYLLGSAATGTLRADSDIDLGIMIEPGLKISALKRIKLANSLSYKIKRIVDMGEISSKNLIYAREALLKGILIYSKNQNRVNLYRANLLGLYIQFNFDRQEVVDAYRTR